MRFFLNVWQRSWYSHSSGFAGFSTIHRDKSPRGAANAKLPPSPAIVGYTMLATVIICSQGAYTHKTDARLHLTSRR